MKSSINLRFLLASLVGFSIFGVATHLVHAIQVQRESAFLLDRARQSQTGGRFEPALQDYQQYLLLVPKDAEAHAEFGMLLAQRGLAQMAVGQLEAALRSLSDRDDLRRRLVELDIDLKRFGDAREHLVFLLTRFRSDGKLQEQIGICQEAGGDYLGAAESFQRSIEIDRKQCDPYVHLAEVLRLRLNRTQEADSWIEKLVVENADSSMAHLLRARYLCLRTKNQEKIALREAERAVELDPKDADAVSLKDNNALLLAAKLSGLTGDYDKARRYAERAIAADPALADGYLTLYGVEIHTEHPEKAVEVLHRGIEKASEPRQLLWDLGRRMVEQSQAELDDARKVVALDVAQKTVEQLRRLPADRGFDPLLIDYLQAQIEVSQGHWYAASLALGDVARQLERPKENDGSGVPQGTAPELLKDVECRLALCYGQLGDAEAQLAAYRKAAVIDPLYVKARLGVAATLSALGQVSESLEEYRQISRLNKDMVDAGDFQVARLLVLKNLRLQGTEQDWKEVEAILDRLQKKNPDAVELTLLRAEALFGQHLTAETERLLMAARDKYPQKTEIWSSLVLLACRGKQWDRAVELLAATEKKFGDQVFLRLARGQYLLSRYGKEASAGLAKLGADAAKFSAEDRLRLFRELATDLWEAQDLTRAKQFAGQACEADGTNLAVRLQLFELTFLSKDASGMEQALAEIRSVQKEGALWHYGEAVRLAVLAESQPDEQKRASQFRQALEHLSAAHEKRPGWGRIALLAGQLYDRLGQVDAAIENYREAIDKGERKLETVRRASFLLYNRQRYAEADGIIRRLEQRQAVFYSELGRLASDVSIHLENIDRAVEISRQVAKGSTNWDDYRWLGELQAVLGRQALAEQFPKQAMDYFEDAEKSFRTALSYGRDQPETWVGLIRFLASTNQKEAAHALLGDAIKNIPADKAALALGPCYEALGKLDEATKQYQSILAKGAKDPIVLRNVAEFCIRVHKPQEAEDYLQRIMGDQVSAKPADVAWARRTMAGILRQRGGYANLLKAVALVDQNLAGGSGSDDLREKAMLLSGFPQKAKRLEAIDALEQVVRSQPTEMAEIRLALARLYLREKDWRQTNEHMRALLTNHGKESRFVAEYVAMLMDRNEMEEAGLWLDRLEELAPENSNTILLQAESLVRVKPVLRLSDEEQKRLSDKERQRLLDQERQRLLDQAIELLHKFLDRSTALQRPANKGSDRDDRILKVVSILKTIASDSAKRGDKAAQTRFLAEMETLVRDYVTRHPGEKFLLASALLQQGRVDEALAIAEETWPQAELGVLESESQVLIGYPGLTAAQVQRLERLLLSIVGKRGRTPLLLLVIGDLRMRQHPQDAVEIYREVLKKDEDNFVALNNLALLLALQKQNVEEALKLVDRAIAIAGPVPDILDTRATVLIESGRLPESLADLDEAIRDGPSSATLFHRALVHWRLGQQRAATEDFRKALNMGLKSETLLELERPNYAELERNLTL